MTPTPESQQAAREWRCFHCDELFTDPALAAQHFGCEIEDMAACRQLDQPAHELLAMVSSLHADLRRACAEDTPADRLYHSMSADRARAVREAEEQGYRRGLEDGRRDWFKILYWRLKARFA